MLTVARVAIDVSADTILIVLIFSLTIALALSAFRTMFSVAGQILHG
jgi:hypothetical protein